MSAETRASDESRPRLALAANRPIGAYAARILQKHQCAPRCLLLAEDPSDNSAGQIRRIFPDVPTLVAEEFRAPKGVVFLDSLRLDWVLCVHFPFLLPPEVLALPRRGCLNLHPAYLPWNRGWHTASWAILENTPAGACLHWMDEGLDTGPIALRREVAILPEDTGDSLYRRILKCEEELLDEAVPRILTNTLPVQAQAGPGTSHRKRDLERIAELKPDQRYTVRQIVDLLRALTTSDPGEAAWFRDSGSLYRLRVTIVKEPEPPPESGVETDEPT